jgi:hypothetical protein
LHMLYYKDGSLIKYRCSDLHYDVKNGSLIIVAPVAPVLPVLNATFSTLPLNPVAQHVEGVGEAEFDSTFFGTDVERRIRINADTDPLFVRGSWAFNVQIDGIDRYFEMCRDHAPHGPVPDAVCNKTFMLSSKEQVFMSHSQLKTLDSCERRQDILNAITTEYSQFDDRCMWRLCELPDGADKKRMMLLVKAKLRPDGTEEKVKARAVLLGNSSFVPDVDYDANTFAPNAQTTTARVMCANAVQHDLNFKSCDVRQAFTFGEADRRVFVGCPPGRQTTYGPDGRPLVYEILKNCYGSPAAPKRWHIAIHNAMIRAGFRQSTCDPCLYLNGDLHVLIYTDDCLSTYPKTAAGARLYCDLITMLTTQFELGDDGMQDCENFIGMHFEFNTDRTQCTITQPQKLNELITDAGMTGSHATFTTGVPKVLISTLDCPSDDDVTQKTLMKSKPYRKRVGQLLWLARTSRPDLSYQVNCLSRVGHNPGLSHWHASSMLIRYVNHTRDYGLVYKRSPTLLAVPGQWKPVLWTDATWASDYGDFYDNYCSTTGWVCQIGDCSVSWSSTQQGAVAQSSAESEWYAAADGAKEALYMRKLFHDLQISLHGPVNVMCDNQSAIRQSINAVDQKNSRHVGMKCHFLRQQCHAGNLELHYVPTQEQRADIFTKCLPQPAHEYLRPLLGIQRPVL